MNGDLRSALAEVLPSVRADLERLVRIPSVSADPEAAAPMRESAHAVADLLRDAGLPEVAVLAVPDGQPAVVARRPGPPGAPTVLLYAHHDVQPAGPPSAWDSPPFEPTERAGRLYARGAADDKAGVAVHLAALRAHAGDLPVGVTVLVEGEEEIGSPTLAPFLSQHGERLAADVVLIADSTNWAVGRPALTTSVRGLVDCVVEVRTLRHAIHSGMYGGPVPDALTALCRLLATLHDEAGNVAVPGLGTHEREGSPDLSAEQLRADAGLLEGVRLLGEGSLTDRLWSRPALSVLAVDAPRVVGASNTLVPSARAKVSLRVAPGQDANGALTELARHLQQHAPWGAVVRVIPGQVGQPFSARVGGSAYDAAREALAEAWGAPPVDIGVGGSIPFVAAFAERYPGAALLLTGVEDPDTRAHGANESLHLGDWEKACLAEALLLDRLARRDD